MSMPQLEPAIRSTMDENGEIDFPEVWVLCREIEDPVRIVIPAIDDEESQLARDILTGSHEILCLRECAVVLPYHILSHGPRETKKCLVAIMTPERGLSFYRNFHDRAGWIDSPESNPPLPSVWSDTLRGRGGAKTRDIHTLIADHFYRLGISIMH